MSRRTVGTRVFVGGLSYRVRERDLEKFFQKIGRVTDISMKNGFAFVEFDDYRDADDAVYELNGKELMGERVAVEMARGPGYQRPYAKRFTSSSRPSSYSAPRPKKIWLEKDDNRDSRDSRNNERYGPPTRTEYRVVVENLSSRVSWQDLKDYMRQAGEVTYADAHKQHKNEGVVEFSSYSDMKNALERLDGTELNGRRIRLVEDKRRRRSRSSTSRSRSKSGSRSASRGKDKSVSRSRSPRSKSNSPRGSKSPADSKRRAASRSPAPKYKRSKRSESDSPDNKGRRFRSRSGDRNGRSAGSGDDD